MRLFSASVAGSRSQPDGSCDLAVIVNPTSGTLRKAAQWLRDGGVCYVEWRSALHPPLAEARSRLLAAGFRGARFYTAWPSLAGCERWLPLDAPEALAYGTHPDAPFARRVDRRGLRVGARLLREKARRLLAHRGVHAPVCVVALKSVFDTHAEPWYFGAVRRSLIERATGPVPQRLSAVTLTGGPRSISKVVGLVFCGDECRPALAVKMARVPEAHLALTHEADALESLFARTGGTPATIPAVLFRGDANGPAVIGETAVLGDPLFGLVRRHNYRAIALQATAWLADLAARTASSPAPTVGRFTAELEEFAAAFAPVADPRDLHRTAALLDGAGALPAVFEQRDFSPWNVLRTTDGLAALDWESAAPRGLPALDLTYFLAHLAFSLDGAMGARRFGPFRRSFRESLREGSFSGAVRRECLDEYARAMALSPAAMRALSVFTWVSHARSEYRNYAMDAAGRPTARILRRSMFLRLWQDELRFGARNWSPRD